jgi:hypothetical protein
MNELIKERRAVTLKRKRRSLLVIGNGRAVCACCGEREIALLTIDHIAGGGAQHRRELGARGMSIHQWIRANPDEARARLQPLCYSCHFGKDILGICPHRLKVRKPLLLAA